MLWSLPDWKKVREVGRDAGLVTAVAIDPKAGRIAIGNKAGKLFLHGLGDGKLIAEGNSTHASPVTALAFSHGETPSLVAARENKLIEAWPSFPGDGGMVDWAPLREFKGHAAAPNHLAFHPADENVFFSAGEDSSVRSWKFKEGNLVKSVTGLGPVKLFALSPDGTRFAVSGTAPGASLWDFATGKKITDLKGNPANSLRSGQAERELTFAKGEQTYFKGEVKKRRGREKESRGPAKEGGEGPQGCGGQADSRKEDGHGESPIRKRGGRQGPGEEGGVPGPRGERRSRGRGSREKESRGTQEADCRLGRSGKEGKGGARRDRQTGKGIEGSGSR